VEHTAAPAIELRGLTKTFGKVVANSNVNLTVYKGEILSLLGENGSGKTTLMNMLMGLYRPDKGEIYIDGKLANIQSPHDAISLGVGMIHQHFKLVDVLTVRDNIVMGTKGNLSKSKADKIIREIAQKFDMNIEPDRKIYSLSVGEKQMVEIMKVLYRGARTLILDEPTAVLTPQEITRLFDILRRMRESGCAIIIITHKLNEVMDISDRVMIMRKGEGMGTVVTKESNVRDLVERMVGAAIDISIQCPDVNVGKNALDVHKLTVLNSDKVQVLTDISFSVSQGEILGVAGVSGSGQKELCSTIAGLMTPSKGAILVDGVDIAGKSARDIIKMGVHMSFIPEDRFGMGLLPSMNIIDNMLLKSYNTKRGIHLDRAQAKKLAVDVVEQLHVYTPSIYSPVRMLSGGNAQKVLLGREISSNPSVLITAYPVRGLDINSSMTIYKLLNEQKEKGVAVLFIGEDLDVILELCDRVMVLCGGKLTGIANTKEVTKEQLGLMMTGHTLEEVRANG